MLFHGIHFINNFVPRKKGKMASKKISKMRVGCLTWRADALIVLVSSLVDACGTVLTSVLGARVILKLASDARESIWTRAVLTGAEVLTDASIHAR